MNTTVNRQFRLAARPVGLPRRSDWNLVEEPVREPGDGEFLVRIQYVSLDPAMRGWMNEGKSYVPPVAIGDVMRAYAAGEVIASKHPKFAAGSHVAGVFGMQQYAVSSGKGVTLVDTGFAPLPVYLGALGMPGMTAYFGLLEVGEAEGRRHRRGFRRRRRGRLDRRPDRENQGLPRDRHRRRRGQVQLHRRRTRLRRRDRLQECGASRPR